MDHFDKFLFNIEPAETVTEKEAREILDMPASISGVEHFEGFVFPDMGIETAKHLAGGKYDHDQSSHGVRGSAAGAARRGQASETKPSRSGAAGGNTPEKAAANKINSIRAMEPSVTKALTSMTSKHGGEMEGLQHRLKTEESLARKIRTDMEAEGLDAATAADRINDALRYTIKFDDPKTFVDNVGKVQADLKAAGWEQYDHKYKNFFKPGGPYRGYNTVLVNKKTGVKFELQFHTKDSLRIKHVVHKLYEQWRTLPNGSPKRESLYSKMVSLWDDLPQPDNWESLTV